MDGDDICAAVTAVAESVGCGLLLLNRQDEIILANAVVSRFINLEPGQAEGRRWQDVLPEPDRERIARLWETGKKSCDLALQERKIRIKEVPLQTGSEIRAMVWEEIEPSQNAVLELRDAYQQIELLKSIINGSFEGIAAVDREGRVLFISEGGEKALGIECRKVLGMPMREIRAECLMGKVARTGIPEMGNLLYVNGVHIPVVVVPLTINGKHAGAICRSVFKNLAEAEGFVKRMQNYYASIKKKGTGAGNGINSVGNFSFGDIIGGSPAIRRTIETARQAARSEAPVMLLGETGTGKELFAHAIHSASRRSGKPFICVNCASIPDALLESELFGYEEGAFTGARKGGKPGKFEMADGGTLFLDEIGDMKLNMQAKLLRALQEGEIEKVGQVRVTQVNVRVVAATNRDLGEMVRVGSFREDLYYRLDVIRVDVPPLRYRMEDLQQLVEHFARVHSWKYGREVSVSPEAMEVFDSYWWPGNIRELSNVIEGAVCFSSQGVITPSSLPHAFLKRVERVGKGRIDRKEPGVWRSCVRTSAAQPPGEGLEEKEKIRRLLELTSGNKRRAAVMLGVARSTLYEKLKKYDL
ncbi:MAG: sigma 54-interacting transcriptional regulator [Firmicutes bacterium]|nr:sigma 54-interacting transcriptional regulator [Bacillota bacterium]